MKLQYGRFTISGVGCEEWLMKDKLLNGLIILLL